MFYHMQIIHLIFLAFFFSNSIYLPVKDLNINAETCKYLSFLYFLFFSK